MKGSSLYGKMSLNRGGQNNTADGRPGSSALQHKKSDDKVHMELWGGEHKNADHPYHWKDKELDRESPEVVKTEGTIEEQKLRKKKNKEKSPLESDEDHFLMKKKKMPEEGMVPHKTYVQSHTKNLFNGKTKVNGKWVQVGWKDPKEGKDAYHSYTKPKGKQ